MSGKSIEDESEIAGAGLKTSGSDVVIQTAEDGTATATVRKFYLNTRKGVLGMTKTSSLGFFPKTTKVGDLVAYFKGSETLFVLREAQDPQSSVFERTMQSSYRISMSDQRDLPTHEFIGACYVHGDLDGKSWKKIANSTEFVL